MNETPNAFPPEPVRCAKAEAWFAQLRDRICAAFEAIEDEFVRECPVDGLAGRFERSAWQRPGGGGKFLWIDPLGQFRENRGHLSQSARVIGVTDKVERRVIARPPRVIL